MFVDDPKSILGLINGETPKPTPRPFKVGDLIRISHGHSFLSARGKTIEISEIDSDGWLYGKLPPYGRIGVDPKNATLIDDTACSPMARAIQQADELRHRFTPPDVFWKEVCERFRKCQGEGSVTIGVDTGGGDKSMAVFMDSSGRVVDMYQSDDTPPTPKSGRTTAMVLDVVLRAVRGQSVRVIADLPFDECFSLCTWIKRMSECAIPGLCRPVVKSCDHGFSVRFAGIRGNDELEPAVYPAVIEVVPKRSSVEGLPTEGWYVCDENGVEL